MIAYAILCNPGHNRVYYLSSLKLAESELAIAAQKMANPLRDITHRRIAGLDYITFTSEAHLPDPDAAALSGLSFTYALFEIIDINGTDHLRPIEKTGDNFIDESVSSILKYTGKTNETFTRMMLNVAYYSQDNIGDIRLLDPVAGKGTTLYEGLIKGFNVYGVEIGDKAVTEAYHYIKKFLETGKYKHRAETQKISGPNKSFVSKKYTFEIARSKESQKQNEVKILEIISGNSINAGLFYKKEFFDIIAGDLPYGVQHGNVTNQKQSSLTRNPSELLAGCLPVWAGLLKPGGAIALAWNVNVLPRADAGRLLEANGLTVLDWPAYLGFEHRVDQSIVRDIIVAKKI